MTMNEDDLSRLVASRRKHKRKDLEDYFEISVKIFSAYLDAIEECVDSDTAVEIARVAFGRLGIPEVYEEELRKE